MFTCTSPNRSRPAQKRNNTNSTISAHPDPESAPHLAELRFRQWRQSSRDPFEPKEDDKDLGPTQSEDKTRPENLRSYSEYTQTSSKYPQSPQSEPPELTFEPESFKTKAPELKHPGPKWVHLFYDLAWTASFATLNQNGKFDNPLDLLNYFLFFAAVMWLWASQTLYSIHFYTNDWFHLFSTFFQLFVFGMLAATTLGYDVTTYIARSPGMDELDPSAFGGDTEQPQQYADEKTARGSMIMIAVAFAATRTLHLLQYLRVYYYARWPQRSLQSSYVHPQIQAVTAGLLLSTLIFLAALGITVSDFGERKLGASLKLGLWIGGFVIEVLSHLVVPASDRFRRMKKAGIKEGHPSDIDDANGGGRSDVVRQNELPVSAEMDLCERLQTVTTIILGEGINGIAGTLSAVLLAPGIGKVVGVNVFCTACTIWFIAYIYFEGSQGDKAPEKTSLRYIIWLILHLPFLASTVFLLMGIKSQFLLTSFVSTLFKTTSGFNHIIDTQLRSSHNFTVWRTNPAMKQFLLERGIIWEDEFNNLTASLNNPTPGVNKSMIMPVWSLRLSLKMVINTFKDFNKQDDSIPDDVQSQIDAYYNNFTQVAYDVLNTNTNPGGTAYYQIMTELLDGPLRSTRYIIAFAGLIFISLSLQDFVHSKLHDRYQWGVIGTRFFMGIILCLLLLLNIGKYQELFVPKAERHQRAGVFQWMEAFWALPTIAIAFGIVFFIEQYLAWRAKAVTEEKKAAAEAKKRAEEEAKKNAAREVMIGTTEGTEAKERTSGGRPKLVESPRQSILLAINQEKVSGGDSGRI